MRIILLDLNYTLVSNSDQKINPFQNQIRKEEYRKDLITAIKDDLVILITARPDHYKNSTLQSIKIKTGWQPANSYFNKHALPPPQCKEKILLEQLVNVYNIQMMLAIESNPKTRAMYNRHNIKAVTYQEFMEHLND